MKQRYEFPRVSTRGRYNLHTGEYIGHQPLYSLFPKKKFDKIFKADEVVIFVHGMRNSPKGAVMGGTRLRRTIRKLGYKHPVVSFSYDADIRGAHLEKNYHKVLKTAYKIAKANGEHLTYFIINLQRSNPNIKIHLVGHSLGCEVVSWVTANVHSVNLLGSPVEVDEFHRFVFSNKVTNHYNPKDAVIQEGVDKGDLKKPSCLNRVDHGNIHSKRITAIHHGFRAYAEGLRKFP